MRKRFIELQEALSQFQKKKLSSLDEINVYHVFLIWFFMVIVFGVIYHFLSGDAGSLFSTLSGSTVASIFDSIYFSFITATSTGYGDIVPKGLFMIMAIIEVTFGLLLLALVTSKFVSIKQNLILGEIYEISFTEKINRLRSSLLLFRQHLSRVTNKVEEGTIRKREINDFYIYVHSLETVLEEIVPLLQQKGGHSFAKVIDPVSAQLLVNSIMQSFERLQELLNLLSENKLEWRRPVTVETILRCIDLNLQLFKILAKKDINIAKLNSENDKIIAGVKEFLNS